MKQNVIVATLTLALLTVSFWDSSLAQSGGNYLAEARAAFNAKNYTLVTDLLMPHLSELKKDDFLILGKAQSELNNSLLAQKVFSAALAQTPDDPEIKSLWAHQLYKLGSKEKESIIALKEVVEKHKTYLPAYRYLIEIFEKRKNRYELRLIYQDMIDRIGEKFEYVSKVCELSTQDSLYDSALKYCQKGIAMNPREPSNLVHLGIVYKDTGKPELAEKNLKRAADSFSKSELAQITFAQFHEEKKNYIDAFKYYQRAVGADPRSIKGLIGVGTSGFEILKLQESLLAFEAACKLDRNLTAPAFRKVANGLRLTKNQVWLSKFESSIEKCH